MTSTNPTAGQCWRCRALTGEPCLYPSVCVLGQWRPTPPPLPGTYRWRRTWQWEDIEREIPASRRIYSERYCQEVPVESLGGEWFY